MNTMKAVVFHGVNDIGMEEVARPRPKVGEALIRTTATTICGTDVHIVKGEYPVRPGLILGHEPVGVIEELGEGLEGEYMAGQRVIVGAITPCGQCFYCLNGAHSQSRGTGRMEVWKHHQRCLGRVPAGSGCSSEPGRRARRTHR
jgi:threonine dehydrogenase-like Zn-dependent dehydrogenase